MKKWTMLLFVAMLTIVLGACGSKGDTVTLEVEQDGNHSEITYDYDEDDIVTKQTTKNVVTYESMGLSSKEEAEEALTAVLDEFEDIEGLNHDITFDDDSLTEELTVDYEKADIEEISELPGSDFSGDYENGIDVNESIKAVEAQGFEVVE